MEEVKIETKTIQVEPRIIKNRFKVKTGTPIFAMSEGVRKSFGLSKLGYFLWKIRMKKLWKNGKSKST